MAHELLRDRAAYEAARAASIEDPEGFWADQAGGFTW